MPGFSATISGVTIGAPGHVIGTSSGGFTYFCETNGGSLISTWSDSLSAGSFDETGLNVAVGDTIMTTDDSSNYASCVAAATSNQFLVNPVSVNYLPSMSLTDMAWWGNYMGAMMGTYWPLLFGILGVLLLPYFTTRILKFFTKLPY